MHPSTCSFFSYSSSIATTIAARLKAVALGLACYSLAVGSARTAGVEQQAATAGAKSGSDGLNSAENANTPTDPTDESVFERDESGDTKRRPPEEPVTVHVADPDEAEPTRLRVCFTDARVLQGAWLEAAQKADEVGVSSVHLQLFPMNV
jgi:hypothetical protein